MLSFNSSLSLGCFLLGFFLTILLILIIKDTVEKVKKDKDREIR